MSKEIRITCRGADTLPIDALIEFQKNIKTISKDNLAKLKRSILKHGFTAPIFVWKGVDYHIIDGHQRMKALLSLREEGYDIPLLPVVYIEADNEKEAKEKLLYITSQYGEFSTDGLCSFIDGLDIDFNDIRLSTGEFNFKSMLDQSETIGDDEAPEVQEEAHSKYGEVYILGEHRLMCGDATIEDDVSKLMGDFLADILVTDPPYNNDYIGKTKDKLKIKNDNMSDIGFREFLITSFRNAVKYMKPGAVFYIWHADSEGYNFRAACHEAGLIVRQCLIWNKNSMVIGRQDYQWKHEPCLYGWKPGAGHLWANDRKQTTVLEFNRPSRSSDHPTMKPVALIEYQILNNTKGSDIILDLFGGSGSTLIAAAKNNRKCNMMEIEPKYCDVIRRRWTKWATDNNREVGSGGLT